MSNEELVAKIQAGENVSENMEQLYNQNRGLIYQFVKPFLQNKQLEAEDLFQEAFLGLYKAAMKYDASSGVLFMSYAHYWIRKQLQRYQRDNKTFCTIPASVEMAVKRYFEFINVYENEHGFTPDDETIQAGLKMLDKTYTEMKQYISMLSPDSLDRPITDDSDDIALIDLIPGAISLEDEYIEQADGIEKANAAKKLHEIVDSLPPERANIIKQVYFNGKTLVEIADQKGCTKQNISLICSNALKRLYKRKDMKEVAGCFGYDAKAAFHGGLRQFKEYECSSVEYLAMKNEVFSKELSVLTEKERAVWLLRQRGNSIAQTAKIVGVSTTMIKLHQRNSKAKIKAYRQQQAAIAM